MTDYLLGCRNVMKLKSFIHLLTTLPDYFVLMYGGKKVNRRITTYKSKCLATLVPVIENKDPLWEYFESVPDDKMSEQMKIHHQKYKKLKAEQLPIKFIRHSTAYIGFNDELTHIEKLVYGNLTFEICD